MSADEIKPAAVSREDFEILRDAAEILTRYAGCRGAEALPKSSLPPPPPDE